MACEDDDMEEELSAFEESARDFADEMRNYICQQAEAPAQAAEVAKQLLALIVSRLEQTDWEKAVKAHRRYVRKIEEAARRWSPGDE